MTRPILSIDFDNVLSRHSKGAMRFLYDAAEHFSIVIFKNHASHLAMINWLWREYAIWVDDCRKEAGDAWCNEATKRLAESVKFLRYKINDAIYISALPDDDRGWQFTGTWPSMRELLAFKPWNKRTGGSSASIDAAMSEQIHGLVQQIPAGAAGRDALDLATAIKAAQTALAELRPGCDSGDQRKIDKIIRDLDGPMMTFRYAPPACPWKAGLPPKSEPINPDPGPSFRASRSWHKRGQIHITLKGLHTPTVIDPSTIFAPIR